MVGVVGVGGTTRRFYVQKVPPLHPNPNHNHNHNHKRHVNLTPLPHNREHVWGWDVPKVPVEVVLGRGHPLPGPISPCFLERFKGIDGAGVWRRQKKQKKKKKNRRRPPLHPKP
jgi:hypothetical protein